MVFIPYKKERPDINFALNRDYFIRRVEHVRLYGWKIKCASIPASMIDIAKSKKYYYERNTGGGILEHRRDVSFAITIKKNREAKYYLEELKLFFIRFFRKIIIDFKTSRTKAKIKKSIFCRDFRNDYEIIFKGFKILSVAVKIEKDFLLIEGSVFADGDRFATKRDAALLLYNFRRFYSR